MRLRRQWICWRYELVGGSWKKPPFDPLTGHRTDTTRRQRWGTYKEAVRAYLAGGYDGIGYVFFPEEHFIRIDFDACRDLETGEIHRWALEVINFLATYVEISPSGDGLHAIARGRLPDRDRQVDRLGHLHIGKLEMYHQKQNYLTWTNDHLDGTPETIEERSGEARFLYEYAFQRQLWEEGQRSNVWGQAAAGNIPTIVIQAEPRTPAQEKADNWLLDRARNARNGETFKRLYDELPGAGSQHEDDFRLCLLLLYWTQDSNGVPNLSWADRLFRHSQRYTGGRWEKWDRKLGKYTYGQVTLYQAYLKRYVKFDDQARQVSTWPEPDPETSERSDGQALSGPSGPVSGHGDGERGEA